MYGKLSKEDQAELNRKLKTSVAAIGLNEDLWGCPGEKSSFKDKYGICGNCKHLTYARSEFRVRVAKCGMNNIALTDNDPIIDCTDFDQVGLMDLNEMKQIATLIDVEKEKKVGF